MRKGNAMIEAGKQDSTLTTKKPKLMWHSNAPWAPTGYGNQTVLFVPRIEALGYDIAITAFYGLAGARINFGTIPIYPMGYHQYGMDVIRANTQHWGADTFISLLDAWVCEPHQFEGVRWIAWYPVDMEPLPERVREKIAVAYKRVVFSRFGQRMTQDAGLDCEYIPHGVDTSIMKPSDGEQIRTLMHIPKDAFVFGMVAANKGAPSRKAFTVQMAAFKELKKKHKDAVLYIHANMGDINPVGVNLPEYAGALGLVVGRDVWFADQHNLIINAYHPKMMAQIYSMMDAHLLVSMGEGFGIPILEAQACGTPVIVGDWTAMSELCFSGWKVPKREADPWWTPLASYQFQPREGAVLDAMEQAYKAKGNQKTRAKARKGALAFDADHVTEKYWKPFLEKVFNDG